MRLALVVCLLLAVGACESQLMVTTKLVGGRTAPGWNGWQLSLVEVHQAQLAPVPGLDRLWKRLERVDTIPYIRSAGTVAVVGDTLVIGLGGSAASVWTYDVRTKELFRRPLPEWLNRSWQMPPPSLSGDGRFIAYLSLESDTTRLTVRSWPQGRIVAQSPPFHLRQLQSPRDGAINWANPTNLQARFSISGPSIAWLQGKVRGTGVEITTWKIYPDYSDPNVRRP